MTLIAGASSPRLGMNSQQYQERRETERDTKQISSVLHWVSPLSVQLITHTLKYATNYIYIKNMHLPALAN